MARAGYQNAVIANGQSLSGPVALGGGVVCGIITPAALTTATALTFQVSYDGGTFVDLHNESAEYSVTVDPAASWYVRLSKDVFEGAQAVRVRTGSGASPVSQGAARTFIVVYT